MRGGVTRITRLNAAQKAQLPKWRDRWIAIGLSTEPAKWEEAEAGIRGCYAAAKLVAPPIIRVGSPLVAVIAGPVAESILMAQDMPRDWAVGSAVYSAVRSAVYSAIDSAVGSAVYWAVDSAVRSAIYSAIDSAVYSAVSSAVYWAVGSAVDSAVGSAISSAVYSAIDSAVGSAVGSAVRSAVGSAVYSAVDSAVSSAVDSAVYSAVDSAVSSAVDSAVGSAVGSAVRSTWVLYRGGASWAGWYGYISFLRDVCHWQNPALVGFAADEQHACNAGWCWQGIHCAILSDRPASLCLVNNRLHCDNGPSIAFRDGWKLWHIEGVQVDQQIVIHPETQTVDQIHNEGNAEVQRIRIERFGWMRYLAESGAMIVNSRCNDIDGTREALVQTRNGQRRLVCSCPSTAKTFAMHVPRDTQTCEQAQRWLAGDRPFRLIGAS